ncbi:hypothetical protein AG1IA_02973 [Rhizoctonia solani AG-1 IA]|uniref:Uncharacterized protein n=1 Tax=Thanatephorus cucumeris (strain AG1-IA) TaxID=983506 RepID=L8X1M4_THACA|nr:hypothetical protein AG1IA_02973 [Rhizoctonia solani AG-1 IA]
MPAAKRQKTKAKQLRKAARPCRHSRAKDEQVRDGMRDTSDIYQITKHVSRQAENKAASVEELAAGLLILQRHFFPRCSSTRIIRLAIQ